MHRILVSADETADISSTEQSPIGVRYLCYDKDDKKSIIIIKINRIPRICIGIRVERKSHFGNYYSLPVRMHF